MGNNIVGVVCFFSWGVIFVFFAAEWNPQKGSLRKAHSCAVQQTLGSVQPIGVSD